MERYADYQPTQFDPKGYCLEDHQDWLVAPVIQTRDSGCLERSNFRTVLADLGGESDNVEVHRFGHWGPGWFEIIIVRPDTAEATKVEQWEAALADYPIASEDDFSMLEVETACEYWETLSIRDRMEYVERDGGLETGESIFSIRHSIPRTVRGEIYSMLAS